MGHVAKAESRRLQVERFVTLFPGRNSRAGVGTGSHCALSHCQGHRKKESTCSLKQALLSRTPEWRDERTLLALPWLGVLSRREAWGWEGGQANLVKLAAWGRLIGGGESGGGEAI